MAQDILVNLKGMIPTDKESSCGRINSASRGNIAIWSPNCECGQSMHWLIPHGIKISRGMLTFPDGDRHDGSWIENAPGPDGLRKYLDGRRNFSPITRTKKHSRSKRCRLWYTINHGQRVVEDWNGDISPWRESAESIPAVR